MTQITQKMKERGVYITTDNDIVAQKPDNFTGVFKHWFENGQLFIKIFFKNGERHGDVKIWNIDGQLEEETFYENGEEVE